MIDVGWSESARPTRTRMLLAADDVRKMINRDPDGSNGLGLLIAYIGRQLGDRALIKEGLDFIEDPRIISLVPQLREIWLRTLVSVTDCLCSRGARPPVIDPFRDHDRLGLKPSMP